MCKMSCLFLLLKQMDIFWLLPRSCYVHLSPGALIAQSPLVQKLQQENTIISSSIKSRAMCGAAGWPHCQGKRRHCSKRTCDALAGRLAPSQHCTPWTSRRPLALRLFLRASRRLTQKTTFSGSSLFELRHTV